MDAAKVLEIQNAAKVAAVDVVKAQIAKGLPNKGITKARHAAIVADVATEMIESFMTANASDGVAFNKDMREVLRAAFSGDLLNASQLRQNLEKAGVLVKEVGLSSEYGVE